MSNVEAVSEMLKPRDAEMMRCFPVSSRVNHVANDDPECFVGLGRAVAAGEAYLAVDKIAEGILRLAGMDDGRKILPQRKYPHRHVIRLLESCAVVQEHYRDLVACVAEDRETLTEKTWNDRWCSVVRQIAETIAGGQLNNAEAITFLRWSTKLIAPESPPVSQRRLDNMYRYSRDGKQVNIRVGSIHSVKGETHTATWLWRPSGKYSRHGKSFRESSHSTNEKHAEKLLQRRLAEITTGTFSGPQIERVRVDELAEEFLREYRINGRKSLYQAERRWSVHLKPFFGGRRAVDVTSDLLARYVDCRQEQGAQNATINRELAALKRMFSLAARATPVKVLRQPAFPHLAENNVRQGFLEDGQYTKLVEYCP